MIEKLIVNNHKQFEFEVGLQMISSERNRYKEIEIKNEKLKIAFALTTYFYKWKIKSIYTSIDENKIVFENQQRTILNELRRMKEMVFNTNKTEAKLFEQALTDGKEIVDMLLQIKKYCNPEP
jgi:hypothetical protein